MYNTIEYFLTKYKTNNTKIKEILLVLSPDVDSWKIIKNAILESELIVSVSYIFDVPMLPEKNIDSVIDLVNIDKLLIQYYSFMNNPFLINIANKHFSPIYRVAAFVLDLIETLYLERNK